MNTNHTYVNVYIYIHIIIIAESSNCHNCFSFPAQYYFPYTLFYHLVRLFFYLLLTPYSYSLSCWHLMTCGNMLTVLQSFHENVVPGTSDPLQSESSVQIFVPLSSPASSSEGWEWITFALLLCWNFQFFSSSFLLNPLVSRILCLCASWESMEERYIIWDLICTNILMFSFHPSNLIDILAEQKILI